ncbi:PIN domain-containing protein [Rhodohalobacter sp.]|uniref:PIN domain-containing protein n=1 Tax=Rhodohalobacter sp. TaxID=1974210 RepID=UPI002ACD764E|nr:PIN domain-containing protein [Rhodohalobacter sp.]MDZ7757269.1 PIN domain-containing protein [Rhodohalobacter sp.]
MKVLFDTNVLLDVFLEREPFFEASSRAVGLAEEGKIEGWLCGTTVTTIHYLLAKSLNPENAEQYVMDILKIFHIAAITRAVLVEAVGCDFADYEDGVIHQSAIHANLDAILTRNQKDFKKSELPVYSPAEFLKVIEILE